jgi:hypothetical protein
MVVGFSFESACFIITQTFFMMLRFVLLEEPQFLVTDAILASFLQYVPLRHLPSGADEDEGSCGKMFSCLLRAILRCILRIDVTVYEHRFGFLFK